MKKFLTLKENISTTLLKFIKVIAYAKGYYICKAEPDVITPWNEDNNPKPDSKPMQRLETNLSYNINWFLAANVNGALKRPS